MGDLYWKDILSWSQLQADYLRRLQRGERPNEVDWENIIEEIEAVGRSELHAFQSLLTRALEHMLKRAAWPGADPERHWLAEAETMLADARAHYAPSMAQRTDLQVLYRRASRPLKHLRVTGPEAKPKPLTSECPFELAELLDPSFDVASASERPRLKPGI